MQLKQIMKYKIMLVAVGASLLLAIPLSHLTHHKDTVSKPRVTHSAVIEVAKIKPTVAPKPIIKPVVLTGCNAYVSLLNKYDWDVKVAMAIMHAESGCSPTAMSSTCDRGLMQVNCIHADLVQGNLNALYDPATNINAAYQIYRGGGWGRWTTYNSGAYIKYL